MRTKIHPDPRQGLSSRQVEQKKSLGLQNTEPESITKTTRQILRDHICTLFNLFNVLIALALAAVGAWSNLLFILIIAFNTLIGIVQELHAKKLVDRLSLLSMPRATVVRDGRLSEVALQELVEEDVIELEAGRQVCSDSVILTGEVEVNESLLTGESDATPKAPGDSLLSGSFIVSGRCRAVIEHVGLDNYASQTLAFFRKEGVDLKLISGDHPQTVAAIARQAGLAARTG